ncbi:MAG: acyl-CoA dehydrogenase family protein [Caldilineales bacterium]|nr:acyl-CoA dehydrogenase family protein [Caldilineales bacterium]MCW5857472.1 acyl-CoA dehydrogenase family protein [Caldilineales bacterium]
MNSPVDTEQVRQLTRAFVEQEIPVELARQIDRQDSYPAELLRKFSATGLWGVNIAAEYGGLGGRSVDAMPIYEELSRRLPVLAWVIGNIMLYGNDIIGVNGSEAQRQKFLPALAEGRLRFSFALTEPGAGSDAANLSTKAVYRDGAYWITGSKLFITGAGVSDVVVTLTRTDAARYRGITAFLVDTATPGFSASPLEKLGYHGSNTCAVYYDQVRVAEDEILGGPACLNQGWQQMVMLLNAERLALSACALGIAQGALDETIAFARERYGSGNPRFQSIQHTIVDMATELEAARRLAYHAAQLEREGRDCLKETSMSKYFASETAKKIALRGIDILGAEGGSTQYDVQRYLRDVLVLCIGGGATQIQKNIIAKVMAL